MNGHSIALVSVAALLAILFAAFSPKDDSDPPTGRSGLNIYIDNLTGCQYLSLPLRSLTPRMGADGKQICAGEKK